LCPIKNSPLSFFLVSLSEREGVREREKMKDRRMKEEEEEEEEKAGRLSSSRLKKQKNLFAFLRGLIKLSSKTEDIQSRYIYD